MSRWLRKAGQPHVYNWTQILADRGDMIECTADGKALNPKFEAALLAAPSLPEISVKPVVDREIEAPASFAPEDSSIPSIEEVVRRKRSRR